MSSYNPPVDNLSVFSTTLFKESNSDTLTISQADKRYLKFPLAQGTENFQDIITTNLTANGTVGLNTITPLYTTLPNLASNNIGFVYSTTSTTNFVSSGVRSILSLSGVVRGKYIVSYQYGLESAQAGGYSQTNIAVNGLNVTGLLFLNYITTNTFKYCSSSYCHTIEAPNQTNTISIIGSSSGVAYIIQNGSLILTRIA